MDWNLVVSESYSSYQKRNDAKDGEWKREGEKLFEILWMLFWMVIEILAVEL